MDILGRSYLLITSGRWKVKSKSMLFPYEQRKKTLVDELQLWEQFFFFSQLLCVTKCDFLYFYREKDNLCADKSRLSRAERCQPQPGMNGWHLVKFFNLSELSPFWITNWCCYFIIRLNKYWKASFSQWKLWATLQLWLEQVSENISGNQDALS